MVHNERLKDVVFVRFIYFFYILYITFGKKNIEFIRISTFCVTLKIVKIILLL